MYVINLFGAPGAGKSTIAAGLFNQMKIDGYNVEYVTEFAKDLVYEDNMSVLNNQLYVTATQDHRMRRLIGKVDYVITDSPLLLGIVHAKGIFKIIEFENLIVKIFNSYNNINFYIERYHKYSESGRLESESESNKLNLKTIETLKVNNIDYCYTSTNNYLEIYYTLKNRKVL